MRRRRHRLPARRHPPRLLILLSSSAQCTRSAAYSLYPPSAWDMGDGVVRRGVTQQREVCDGDYKRAWPRCPVRGVWEIVFFPSNIFIFAHTSHETMLAVAPQSPHASRNVHKPFVERNSGTSTALSRSRRSISVQRERSDDGLQEGGLSRSHNPSQTSARRAAR